jgi:mono/diheme cytochrome c family protein
MLFALLSILSAQLPGREVELWTRASGTYDRGAPPSRLDVRTIDLETLPLTEVTRYDVQLEAFHTFQGISLADLLDGRVKATSNDAVLLHFANGMIVPVHGSERAEGPPAHAIFIALAIQGGRIDWEKTFPEIAKRRTGLPDPRPIVFSGNKIVVSEIQEEFSPWRHVDTLTGIELVSLAAWEAQFEAGTGKEAQRGRAVFLHRCQFCHAARDVGGRFGWDFIDPIPLYSYRSAQNLHAHVKYTNADAVERGYMMPAQRDVDVSEIEALWVWMKAAAADGLKPYRP